MNKHAGKILDLVIDRIQKYAPQAAVVGGGLAGISHLIAMNNQRNEEQEEKEKENTLYIDIPKTAGVFDTPTMPQYLLDSGLAVGTTLAAGGVGYAVVDSILKNVRKKKSEEELEGIKSEYSRLLTQKVYGKDTENDKRASQVEFENIEALALCIHDAIKNAPVEKIASDETMGTIMTSLPGVGALITGILAHNYWYNREKDIETGMLKTEAENTKRSPALIKLRTVDEEEEDKMAAFTPSNILAGTVGSEIAALNPIEEEKEKPKKKKPKKEIDVKGSISDVDDNTSVVKTEDGDVQINATDSASKKKLNRYKEEIAKSVLLALNTESDK